MNAMLRMLLEASIRVILVAAVIGVVLGAARVRSGAVRHAAWAAVVCAMLLMPVLPYCVPSIPLREDAVFHDVVSLPPPSATAEVTGAVTPPPPPLPGPASPMPWRISWALLALVVYALGACGLAVRLLFGWRAARRFLRAGTPVAELSREVPVFESPCVAAPLAIGVARARVILPLDWRTWSAGKLRAVLAHETAHVRRRDPLVQLMARINRCLFWFHPLAWWLERRLAATAEQACDDAGARALGDTRQYAGILVDLAEAVRNHGGRLVWHGAGMDGAGPLGARIDRILRGDGARAASRRQKAIVAVSCVAAMALAAACRQAPKALTDDPATAESRARNQAEQQLVNEAKAFNAQQAAALEAALVKNPEDLTSLKKLLVFYSTSGAKVHGEKPTVDARRRHILWLIQHHPEDELAGSWGARMFPTALDELPDPVGYAEGRKLWLAQTARADTPSAILANAAMFFEVADKPLAEQMLLRAQALDPKPAWSYRLGSLYYQVIVGSNASMPLGVVRSVNRDAHGPYAEEVRQKLAASSDVNLLVTVGERLTLRGRLLFDGHIDFDPFPLGKQYLERALQLDPKSDRAHAALWRARAVEGQGHTPAALLRLPFEEQHRNIAAMGEGERFPALAELAQTAYIQGDSADYYKHDTIAARAAWEEARRDAEEALALAGNHRKVADYGTAIFKANMVLGMLAMRDGDKKTAVSRMLAASKAPRTDELAYSLGYFTYKLAGQLLKYGERDSVVEFLERFAQVNVSMKAQLLEAADQIRHGKKPIWFPDSEKAGVRVAN